MDYSVLFEGRTEGFEKFGNIYRLPILRSAYDHFKQTYKGGSVLDVGAGKGHYLQKYVSILDEHYFSLDNDPSAAFTYHQVSEIDPETQFDWIILNQLVEHLTVPQASTLLIDLHPHLHPGGMIAATTPNIFHPNRYWGDPTHITPWGHSALYGLFKSCGYQVTNIYRYSKNRGPMDPLSWLVERIMRRIYRIDWCDSILLIATREA